MNVGWAFSALRMEGPRVPEAPVRAMLRRVVGVGVGVDILLVVGVWCGLMLLLLLLVLFLEDVCFFFVME